MDNMGKLFCVAILKGLFRAGEPAEIVGKAVVAFKKNSEPRLCFKIRFNDSVEDLVPVFTGGGGEKKNPLYQILTEADIREGRVPKATE